MKRFNILMMLLICLFTLGCGDAISAARQTDLSKEQVAGLVIGKSIKDADFREKYGKNMQPIENESTEIKYYKLTPDLKIAVKQDQIARIIIQSDQSRPQTVQGIAIGSSKQQVFNTYGDNHYERSEQGAKIYGYVDHERKTKLEFWMYEDQVNMIRFDSLEMK